MNKKIGKKLFGLICVFIVLVSSWGGFLGQAIAFKTTVVWDRADAQHEISVPEAGDAIKIPEEVDQSGATCESMQNSFTAGTQKKLKEEWIRQGELSEAGWAYLEIDGEKRYLVALTPVFGLPGDYVDIYLTYNGEDKVYPCMIFDAKDTWVDDAYIYDGIAYGHLAGRNSEQCNIIEIITPNAIGDYEGLSAMMATLTGVTQIANGGSWLENPDGPTGLEGPYNYLDGSSGAGNDDSSVGGIIGGWLRDFWDYLAVLFENSVNDEDNVTTLYDIKNLNDKENEAKNTDGNINGAGINVNASETIVGEDFANDEIEAMFNEFLNNRGRTYIMDHSNLNLDNCMSYYDCSSWTIHCLAHSGVARLGDSTAEGLYFNYCTGVAVEDRQPGDLIFLQKTYSGAYAEYNNSRKISHVGIYLGQMTVNGIEGEWIIDTGSQASGRCKNYPISRRMVEWRTFLCIR